MQTVWLGNLKNDERDGFRAKILQSKIVLDKLQEIVYNMHKTKSEVKFSDYDSASWSQKQAHTNGYCEAMRDVLALLDLDKKAPTNG